MQKLFNFKEVLSKGVLGQKLNVVMPFDTFDSYK